MTNRNAQLASEALDRAQQGQALTNYPAIFQGFMDRGIPEADIRPRENVLTFNAWKALGRHVRKGEHGVKVLTWIPTERTDTDPATGERKIVAGRRPKTAVVFHVSQTDPSPNGDGE